MRYKEITFSLCFVHLQDMTSSYVTPAFMYNIVFKVALHIKYYSTLPFGVKYHAFFNVKISQLMS